LVWCDFGAAACITPHRMPRFGGGWGQLSNLNSPHIYRRNMWDVVDRVGMEIVKPAVGVGAVRCVGCWGVCECG
jgi:hypothetical protein